MDFPSCHGCEKERLEQIYNMLSVRKAFTQLQTNLILNAFLRKPSSLFCTIFAIGYDFINKHLIQF